MNRPTSTSSHRRVIALCVFAALIVLITGCTVKFISSYDQVFDTSITNLQLDLESFFTKMEASAGSAEGTYTANKTFYDEMDSRLHTVLMRAEATPKNEITVKQVNLLIGNIGDLRILHEQNGDKGLTTVLIDPVRIIMDVQFKSMITAEIAKMRGH